ncbi:serine/threonine protein kinase [Candidatus Sumerlaeota bacterium]|nr:serine/threonine protein kinase [Candidatus Sumerlaeota bacterium]
MKAIKVGDIVDEKYEILHVLGQGGMGAVYSARHIELDSIRALKIPDPSLLDDEIGRRMFVREAQAVERLSHPNIARVYDVVNKPDKMYIAMEFIKGIEVSEYLNKNREQLTVNSVLNLLEQICQALDYAHDQGIIHRDIKPNNIMVTVDEERVKVLDFGIARISGKTMADFTLKSAGTPRYMAPEQFRGLDSTRQTDQYSLGVIVYHIFAGHPVFAAETSDALGYQHVNEPPPPLQTHNAKLPKTLNDCVLKALSKNAADRYPTCTNFYQALRASLIHCIEQPLTEFLEKGPQREMSDDELVGATVPLTMRAGETKKTTMHGQKTVLDVAKKSPLIKIGLGVAAVAIIAIGLMLMMSPGPDKVSDSGAGSQQIAQSGGVKPAGGETSGISTPETGAGGQVTQPPVQVAVNPVTKEMAGLKIVMDSLDSLSLEREKVKVALAEADASWKAEQSIDASTQELIKEYYSNQDALREKNRVVGDLLTKNKELVERGLELRKSDWVDSIEASPLPSDSSWKADSLKALLSEPYSAGQDALYASAEKELEGLAEIIGKVEASSSKRRNEELARLRGEYQSLDKEVGELAKLGEPLAGQAELKPQYDRITLMEADVKDRSRMLQLQPEDYSKTAIEEHNNALKELYSEYQAVRKALYQKPIITTAINDSAVEIDYDFEAEKAALKQAFINDKYLLIDEDVENDAIFNIEITFKAQQKNKHEGAVGEVSDWYHYYEIKLKNGKQVLDTLSDSVNLVGYASSQRYQKAYKDKVAKFEAGFAENMQVISNKIDERFAEFKQSLEK